MSETQCENQSKALGQEALTMMKNWYSCKARKDNANYLWILHRNDLYPYSSQICKSSVFKSLIHGHGWYLEVRRVSDKIAVFSLVLNDDLHYEKNIYVKCKLDIVNVNDEILKSGKSEICHLNQIKGCLRVENVLEIPLLNRVLDESLLFNDRVHVCCEVKFCVEKSAVKTSQESSVDEEEPFRVCEDFGVLLKNQLLSDVTLTVKETQFQAHKIILAARSSVFAAMFNHPMKENLTNSVEIADIDANVVKEMLSFIYTGKCEHLDQLAEQLLIAANKYDLKGLKIVCEQVLGRKLTIENALDTLIFADLHHADGLKSRVIEFIVAESTKVMETASWRKNAVTNPHLTVEVCEAMSRLGMSDRL